MNQQDKKSEFFIAHNSYHPNTIDQEVQALEFEGRKVEVTEIEECGIFHPGQTPRSAQGVAQDILHLRVDAT